jgi:hypothetical protein
MSSSNKQTAVLYPFVRSESFHLYVSNRHVEEQLPTPNVPSLAHSSGNAGQISVRKHPRGRIPVCN